MVMGQSYRQKEKPVVTVVRENQVHPPPNNLVQSIDCLIRVKVSKLIFQSRIHRRDREDAQQDTVVHLLTRLNAYDAARGDPSTFIGVTIDHYLANWLRDRRAQKRTSEMSPIPLSSLLPLPVGEFLDEDIKSNVCWDRSAFNSGAARDLELDIAWLLDQLPPNLREIALELRFRSKAEVARRLKISPTTVYHGIRRLRQLFASSGFGQEPHELVLRKGTYRAARSSEGKRAQNPHAACRKVG